MFNVYFFVQNQFIHCVFHVAVSPRYGFSIHVRQIKECRMEASSLIEDQEGLGTSRNENCSFDHDFNSTAIGKEANSFNSVLPYKLQDCGITYDVYRTTD